MKSHTKYLTFNVPARMDFVHITTQVQNEVSESGVKEGLCLVNAMHITASVFINDNEGGLHDDYKRWLEELAPHEPISRYKHNRTGEDNGDAHHKRQIT
jgi:secondary thiamine-phosphate synthase enzyme